MSLGPIYRMTIFAPNSEETVLTPAASAPHSSEFKVATEQGIVGFEPFLELPGGRKSALKPREGQYIIGTTAVILSDQKTDMDGSDLLRFITGFIGDENGKARLIGLKAVIEESTDFGTTFAPYYIGRIDEFVLMSPFRWKITLKDGQELQKDIMLFEREALASISYANKRTIMPLGPDKSYGPLTSLFNVRGKWRFGAADTNRAIQVRRGSNYNAEPGRMWISKPLLNAVEHGGTDAWKITSQGQIGPVIARVTQGGTTGRFYVTYAKFFNNGGSTNLGRQPFSLHSITLEEIGSSKFEYQPLTAFADDSSVTFQLLLENEPSENVPLLITYVHPVQMLKDIMLGSFSQLDPSTGEPIYSGSIPIDVAAFDALIADHTYRDSRWLIKKPEKLGKWVEENILKPYQIAFRIEPQNNGGKFENVYVPFDMRLPKDLSGIQTITEADLDSTVEPTWEPSKPFVNIETKYYFETKTTMDSLRQGGEGINVTEGPINPTLVSEFPIEFLTVDLSNVQAKGGNYKVDARGVRFFPSERYSDVEWQPIDVFFFTIRWYRSTVMRRMIKELHDRAQFRWSRGPATITIVADRVAATNDLKIGEYVILGVDVLPSSFTHTRGASRLVQVIGRDEITSGPYIKFTFVDSGINLQRAAPIVGEFQQIGATNTASGTISVLQPGTVHTSFAITDQSVTTAPDETSSLWIEADIRDFTVSSSQNVITGEFANGVNVFHRAFIQPDSTQDFELPSEFGFEGGDGFVSITGILSPPTNLEVFNISPSGANAQWTVGDATADVEIMMKQDDESNFSNFATLPPGATTIRFTNRSTLAVSNPHKILVRHVDTLTGTVSAEVTASYDITNILIQETAPGPARIVIIDQEVGMYDTTQVEGSSGGLFSSLFTGIGGGFNPYDGQSVIASIKIYLYIPISAINDFTLELQRRTGFTGNFETIRMIRGNLFSPFLSEAVFEMTDTDGLLEAGGFFYRARIVGDGFNPFAYSDPPVFARPAIVPTETEFENTLGAGGGTGGGIEPEYGELDWSIYTSGGGGGDGGDFE